MKTVNNIPTVYMILVVIISNMSKKKGERYYIKLRNPLTTRTGLYKHQLNSQLNLKFKFNLMYIKLRKRLSFNNQDWIVQTSVKLSIKPEV